VTISHLLESSSSVTREYEVPPHSRLTVWVNAVSGLPPDSQGATIRSSGPMYPSQPTRSMSVASLAGHAPRDLRRPRALHQAIFQSSANGPRRCTESWARNASRLPASVEGPTARGRCGSAREVQWRRSVEMCCRDALWKRRCGRGAVCSLVELDADCEESVIHSTTLGGR
jgi:hypothetical protein